MAKDHPDAAADEAAVRTTADPAHGPAASPGLRGAIDALLAELRRVADAGGTPGVASGGALASAVRSATRQRPLAALGLALGAGALVALVLRR
jgi:hypothetical protein